MSQVEVDEVLGLVRHVAAEVAADDAVPGRVVLLVKLLLDECRDILPEKTTFTLSLYYNRYRRAAGEPTGGYSAGEAGREQ